MTGVQTCALPIFDVYEEQTAPLIAYYARESLLRTVRGTGSIDEIQNQIVAIVEGPR